MSHNAVRWSYNDYVIIKKYMPYHCKLVYSAVVEESGGYKLLSGKAPIDRVGNPARQVLLEAGLSKDPFLQGFNAKGVNALRWLYAQVDSLLSRTGKLSNHYAVSGIHTGLHLDYGFKDERGLIKVLGEDPTSVINAWYTWFVNNKLTDLNAQDRLAYVFGRMAGKQGAYANNMPIFINTFKSLDKW